MYIRDSIKKHPVADAIGAIILASPPRLNRPGPDWSGPHALFRAVQFA